MTTRLSSIFTPKTIIRGVLLCSPLLFTSQAHGFGEYGFGHQMSYSPYVGLDLGVSFLKDKGFQSDDHRWDIENAGKIGTEDDAGRGITARAGVEFSNLQLELEYSGRRFDITGLTNTATNTTTTGSGNIDTHFIMANALAGLNLGSFRFIGGGGAGYGTQKWDVKADGETLDDKAHGFAWQGIAGVQYKLSPRMSLDVRYRYINLDDEAVTSTVGTDTYDLSEIHDVTAGITYRF